MKTDNSRRIWIPEYCCTEHSWELHGPDIRFKPPTLEDVEYASEWIEFVEVPKKEGPSQKTEPSQS